MSGGYLQLLNGAAATTNAPRARAFGTIQDVAKASHVDAETVTIHDGYASRVFEYDVSGNGVTAGRINVDISGASDAASVGVILAAAINSATHTDGTAFAMTAVHVGTGLVYVWSGNYGAIGNQAMSETVSNGGYAVSGLTGGVDGQALARGAMPGRRDEGFSLSALSDLVFSMESRSGSGTMTFLGRMWGYLEIPSRAAEAPNSPYSLNPGIWAPLGIATTADTDRGLLNNGVAVAESFTHATPSGDILQFVQAVGSAKHFARLFCQVTTLGGTAPIVDAWVNARGR